LPSFVLLVLAAQRSDAATFLQPGRGEFLRAQGVFTELVATLRMLDRRDVPMVAGTDQTGAWR
jgi:hypothetical protein